MKHIAEWLIALVLAAALPALWLIFKGHPHRVKGPVHIAHLSEGTLLWIDQTPDWSCFLAYLKSKMGGNGPEKHDERRLSQIRRGDLIAWNQPGATGNTSQVTISRLVGLPGDTVNIYNGNAYINGQKLKQGQYAVHWYTAAFPDSASALLAIDRYQIANLSGLRPERQAVSLDFAATENEALELAGDSLTLQFSKLVRNLDGEGLLPNGLPGQHPYQYGPVVVPKRHEFLQEDPSDPYRQKLFEHYETARDTQQRVFRTNYYFILHDYRMNASDSRAYGAIPSHQILGQVKTP